MKSHLTVDCHDGEKLPIIYHGPFSMTTKVPFKEVIETINEFAFKTSQLVFSAAYIEPYVVELLLSMILQYVL